MCNYTLRCKYKIRFPVPLGADNNVVDWDVNQLDKESDESHDGEADS